MTLIFLYQLFPFIYVYRLQNRKNQINIQTIYCLDLVFRLLVEKLVGDVIKLFEIGRMWFTHKYTFTIAVPIATFVYTYGYGYVIDIKHEFNIFKNCNLISTIRLIIIDVCNIKKKYNRHQNIIIRNTSCLQWSWSHT